MTDVAASHWSNRNRPTPQPDPDCECCSGSGTDPAFHSECSECWTPTPDFGRADNPIAIWAAIEALPLKQKHIARNRRRMIEDLRAAIDYPDGGMFPPAHYQKRLDYVMQKPEVAQWAGDVILPDRSQIEPSNPYNSCQPQAQRTP